MEKTSFEIQIQRWADRTNDGFERILKDTMIAAVRSATNSETPVWSGSYVESHRVSVDGKPVAPPTLNFDPRLGLPDKIGEIKAENIRNEVRDTLISKIERASDFGKMEILNKSLHGLLVENHPLYYEVFEKARVAAIIAMKAGIARYNMERKNEF